MCAWCDAVGKRHRTGSHAKETRMLLLHTLFVYFDRLRPLLYMFAAWGYLKHQNR